MLENEAASRTRQKSNSIVDLAEEELSGMRCMTFAVLNVCPSSTHTHPAPLVSPQLPEQLDGVRATKALAW